MLADSAIRSVLEPIVRSPIAGFVSVWTLPMKTGVKKALRMPTQLIMLPRKLFCAIDVSPALI
ncbi:hypothetical protein A6A05_06485 [Magnetospirillum moscoviense]|uniref:Uncharacterized protein n=1 Tax=Magnetospirillum moscoviense TaxID=1437059 RepID=A0A178MYF8_9PROT|nr:hypothetical protein A6A05_06485 [Magnetospirillum moscoviense]